MATLYRYFKNFWKVAVVALVLAAINQIFSLLDPLIFRRIIDSYATRYREYSSPQFIRGVSLLLGAAVGVALVSRIAKNFQDYFVNVITQKVGARIYTDGVRHTLDLPYTLFEDQRSGETLGKLQRVRSDVEKFIAFVDRSAVGQLEFSPEPQNQDRSKAHRDGDHSACRRDD
jgi:ATP-binding cassette, subfamily B, bacterial